MLHSKVKSRKCSTSFTLKWTRIFKSSFHQGSSAIRRYIKLWSLSPDNSNRSYLSADRYPWKKENCNEIRWLPDERTRAVPLRRRLGEVKRKKEEGGGREERPRESRLPFYSGDSNHLDIDVCQGSTGYDACHRCTENREQRESGHFARNVDYATWCR